MGADPYNFVVAETLGGIQAGPESVAVLGGVVVAAAAVSVVAVDGVFAARHMMHRRHPRPPSFAHECRIRTSPRDQSY